MPDDKDTEALRKTNRWIILYLYIPVGIQIILFLAFMFVFKYEPIRFLIHQGRQEDAVKAVRQVYKYATSDQVAHQYIDKIKATSGESSSKLSMRDALFNPQYRNATWFNIGFAIFHGLTGHSIIKHYGQSIFKTID